MRIGLGSDHAGFEYKRRLIEYLQEQGHDVRDFGTFTSDPCDYPLFCRPVAEAIAEGAIDRGIVLGGSGNGEAITANRVRGVRCALVWSEETASLARHHNDANCISIGERMVSWELAKRMVAIWLEEPFDGGRHLNRIRLIDA